MSKRSSTPKKPTLTPPTLTKLSGHPCFSCSQCCTYIATQIDEPTTMKDYDHISWYLYHAGISVYIDWEGAWYLQMETRCENLTDKGLCGIYDHRPAICKDFDWRDCEKQLTAEDEPAEKFSFRTSEQFFTWLEAKRPRTYARYRLFLSQKHAERADPELNRVEQA
ncbi:MAG: YkgJ family cysteine cluster protein [Candidatus Binatia bacterium]|nr:YkgJ family cysteine cluster protein [Candidatus Binatia bacterium]